MSGSSQDLFDTQASQDLFDTQESSTQDDFHNRCMEINSEDLSNTDTSDESEAISQTNNISDIELSRECRNYTLGVFCARGKAEGCKTHRGFNFYSILRQQTHFECPKRS